MQPETGKEAAASECQHSEDDPCDKRSEDLLQRLADVHDSKKQRLNHHCLTTAQGLPNFAARPSVGNPR